MHNSAPLRQRDFSLFTLHFSLKEEKVTPILHSSFIILHLRRSSCVRRITGGYNKAITITEKNKKSNEKTDNRRKRVQFPSLLRNW